VGRHQESMVSCSSSVSRSPNPQFRCTWCRGQIGLCRLGRPFLAITWKGLHRSIYLWFRRLRLDRNARVGTVLIEQVDTFTMKPPERALDRTTDGLGRAVDACDLAAFQSVTEFGCYANLGVLRPECDAVLRVDYPSTPSANLGRCREPNDLGQAHVDKCAARSLGRPQVVAQLAGVP